MPKIALIRILALSVAALACTSALGGAPASDADAGEETHLQSGPPKGYICGDAALTGSGPGFKSSQEESEEAAIKDWLEKAGAVFADADWNAAKDTSLECVKQGLYSKCFAAGIPCHPKPKE